MSSIASSTRHDAAAGDSVATAVSGSATPNGGTGAAAWMLAKREWVRFFRQRNRVTAAILQPLVFWLLFGTGLRGAFQSAGDLDFMQFFLPGTIALVVLFTAIFATISVIEDRREGFMQSVLVSPIGRSAILLGKVLGGAAIAWVQAIIFIGLALLFGQVDLSWTLFASLILLALLALSMCSLGMVVAWPMDSTQGFHAIMMLGLMPMWLLAGTFFPIPAWDTGSVGAMVLGTLMRINPLSYTMVEMRRLMYPLAGAEAFAPPSWVCWTVTVVFVIVVTGLAWHLIKGSRKVDVLV